MSAQSLSRRNYYFASFDQYLIYDNHPKHVIPEAIREQPDDCIQFVKRDPCPERAHAESERRTLLLTGATGMIDLTEIASVRKSFRYLDYNAVGGYNASDSSLNDSLSPVLAGQQEEPTSSRRNSTEVPHETACFDVIMESGVILKLQAPSAATCDAWVHHLMKLMIYWKARKEAVRLIHAKHCYRDTMDDVFRSQSTDEDSHAWFNRAPERDTRIWSYCVFDQCRDIVVGIPEIIVAMREKKKETHKTWFAPEIRHYVLSATGARHIFKKDFPAYREWVAPLLQRV